MNRSRTGTIAARHALRTGGAFALCLFGLLAGASTAKAQVGGEGHVVVATGTYSNAFASGRHSEFAGGGEVVFANRVGVAGELGLFAFGSRISLDGTVRSDITSCDSE